MKTKTIESILRRKLGAWIKHLPEELGKLVGRDAIITGGCITSYYLGEEVNDYDVYFSTKETALAVVKYYCEQFNATQINNKVSRPITPEVQEVDGRIKVRIQSAGVLTDTQDHYEYVEYQPNKTEDLLECMFKTRASEPYSVRMITDNAVSLSDKIQIIHRFYGTPEEIHKNFDFIHAQNYFYQGKLYLNQKALECILSKTLVYNGSLYPIASLLRIRKFVNRGWGISAGQVLKIAFQVNKLDLENPEVLYDQLIGVDIAYMLELLEAVKHQETVDLTYIAGLLDEIFGD